MLGEVPIWQPVLLDVLHERSGRTWWARGEGREAGMAEIERRAASYGLLPIRWPSSWPSSTATAMTAAAFAQASGRVVAFSLAAFRQAFAAGRDLGETDTVLLAAAACELHPRAVLKDLERGTTRERLLAASEEAARLGVSGVPTVSVAGRLFWGDDQLEAAAAALGSGRAAERIGPGE